MTKPNLADLMTTTDIGRMLGITRQGANLLVKRERDFPRPIGKLGHYTVWWRPDIETWSEERYTPVTSSRRRLTPRATKAVGS